MTSSSDLLEQELEIQVKLVHRAASPSYHLSCPTVHACLEWEAVAERLPNRHLAAVWVGVRADVRRKLRARLRVVEAEARKETVCDFEGRHEPELDGSARAEEGGRHCGRRCIEEELRCKLTRGEEALRVRGEEVIAL